MSEKGSAWKDSPSGLDLNPRPPRPVRVSKRAAGVVVLIGAGILALFAYGGYKRHERDVTAFAEGDQRRKMVPATSAGAEIAKAVPSGNLPTAGLEPAVGPLVPPDTKTPAVIVRQPAPAARPPAAPAQHIHESTPAERRLAAEYERERQAMVAPTTTRDRFSTGSFSRTRESPGAAPPDLTRLASAITAAGGGAKTQPDRDHEDNRDEFLAKARAKQPEDYLKSTRTPSLSPYEIKAGWEIPAVLEQSLQSDLPGELKALVTSNVYDTSTGRFLLIPQGSRLVGIYNSKVAYGQEGVQVIWHRLIYPDGSSLNLGGMIGQDSHGLSGFRDKVDHHYKRLAGFAVLTSLFTAASDLATSRNRTVLSYPSPGEVAGAAVGREASEIGAQVTRRNLNVQPTIKIPVGYKFNVRVNRDILFDAPYEPLQP